MQWLWAYIRRKIMESILAGIHDAFTSGDGTSGLTEEQAANALRTIIGIADVGPELEAASSRPSLAAADANGTAAHSETPKRGPGRPRKFQEPPE